MAVKVEGSQPMPAAMRPGRRNRRLEGQEKQKPSSGGSGIETDSCRTDLVESTLQPSPLPHWPRVFPGL
jgi:hypothetical protein